jgi:ATP-binding cassette subfamily B protein
LVDQFSQRAVSLSTSGNYLIAFGLLWFLGEIFWRVGLHFWIRVDAIGIDNLSKNAFRELLYRDYDFYANNFVGSISKKSFAYSRNFETFTDTLIYNVLSSLFPILFVIYVLWDYSPLLPLILVVCLAFVLSITIPLVKKRSKLVALRHDAASRMVGRLSDALTNVFAVKSFANEAKEAKVYDEIVNDYTKKYFHAADYHNLKIETFIAPAYVITNVIGLTSAIYLTGILKLEPGAIVVVFAYFSQVTRIFWDINRTYRNLESSISEAAEFTQLFLVPPVIQDIKDAKNLNVSKGTIEFSKLNFGYCDIKDQEKEENFLSNFSLDIQSKQKIGLVGPSGGGKTTITKLLLRFVDSGSGKIMIDGQDIKTITQSSLRKSIAYVPQEPLLFHRSLFENIANGNETATEKEVLKAAKLAHADEFIKQLPKGYETLVGERGIKLSGGQRQRVAIARALLKKSPILVLDEATSSLDSESEKYIQEGLWELMKDKTALVIAHRLSTVKHLDRIIVLENGKIVQDGTHDELIKEKGLYAKLWGHQSGEILKKR